MSTEATAPPALDVILPDKLTMACAIPLYEELRQKMQVGHILNIYAKEVTSATTPGMQLVLAAARWSKEHGTPCQVIEPSNHFLQAAFDLGLNDEIAYKRE